MKSQHTPGPWRTTGLNVRAQDALICYATNHWADCETPEIERQANANLIASAPDLLSALERIESELGHEPEMYSDILSIANAAIAKAKGL